MGGNLENKEESKTQKWNRMICTGLHKKQHEEERWNNGAGQYIKLTRKSVVLNNAGFTSNRMDPYRLLRRYFRISGRKVHILKEYII